VSHFITSLLLLALHLPEVLESGFTPLETYNFLSYHLPTMVLENTTKDGSHPIQKYPRVQKILVDKAKNTAQLTKLKKAEYDSTQSFLVKLVLFHCLKIIIQGAGK